MDSILKLVYDHWYYKDGKKDNIPNGIHPVIVEKINKKIIEDNLSARDAIAKLEIDGPIMPFNEASFSGYFKREFSENVISIDDISNYPNCIFLYLIEIRFTLFSLHTNHNFSNEGVEFEYSLKDTIPEHTLKLLQSGKIKLVIEYSHDPIMHIDYIKSFEDYIKNIGIDPSNVIISAGNEFKEYLITYPDSKLKLTCAELLIAHQFSREIQNYPRYTDLGYISDIVRDNDLNLNTKREKRFLCFNRTLKPHRYAIAHYALKYNLLDNNIFSFINDLGYNIDDIIDMTQKLLGSDTEDLVENLVKLKSMLPYEIDTQNLPFKQKSGFSIANSKKEWYADTYIHLTTETSFQAENIFFSEKTWRPIANLQPFVYVGNYHALEKLKNLGFKTFHPFIDESYDLETNHSIRIDMIKEEILKLNSKSIQEIHDWYYSITDILLHNQKHFMSFKDLRPFDKPLSDMINFFKDKN